VLLQSAAKPSAYSDHWLGQQCDFYPQFEIFWLLVILCGRCCLREQLRSSNSNFGYHALTALPKLWPNFSLCCFGRQKTPIFMMKYSLGTEHLSGLRAHVTSRLQDVPLFRCLSKLWNWSDLLLSVHRWSSQVAGVGAWSMWLSTCGSVWLSDVCG
jgi:hypothetical protein